MAGVFVCYRRLPEVEHAAGRLHADLSAEFGGDSVFMDVDSVRPGEDWMGAIDAALSECDVFVTVIHPGWIDDDRLSDPEDVLRVEIETALRKDLFVVPVLVSDAPDVRASDLPDPLKTLARRQALPLRHRTWRSDLRPLLAVIAAEITQTRLNEEPDAQTSDINEPAGADIRVEALRLVSPGGAGMSDRLGVKVANHGPAKAQQIVVALKESEDRAPSQHLGGLVEVLDERGGYGGDSPLGYYAIDAPQLNELLPNDHFEFQFWLRYRVVGIANVRVAWADSRGAQVRYFDKRLEAE